MHRYWLGYLRAELGSDMLYSTRIRARSSSCLELMLLSYDRDVLSLQVLRKAYFQVVSIYESAPPSIVHIIGINQKALQSGLKPGQPDLGRVQFDLPR